MSIRRLALQLMPREVLPVPERSTSREHANPLARTDRVTCKAIPNEPSVLETLQRI